LTEEEEEEKEEEEDDFWLKTKPAMMTMMMMMMRRRTTTVAALAEVDSPSCLSLARDQRKTTKVGPTSDGCFFSSRERVLCVFFNAIFSFCFSLLPSDVADDPLLHSSNKGKKRTPKSYDVNNCNGYVPFSVFLLLLLLLLFVRVVVVVETSAAKNLQQERKRRLEEEVDYSESRIVVVILLLFFFFFFFFGRVFGSARIRY
jgi:hypothetical protein